MLSFCIALYNIGETMSFHWALIATKGDYNLETSKVSLFQIVTAPPGVPQEDGYMARHSSLGLLPTDRLICVVQLPPLDMSLSQLTSFVEEQPVGQRDTVQIDIPWKRWGCSQWALRTIKGLIDGGFVTPQSKNSFFTVGASNHGFWKQMLHVSITKCARDATIDSEAGTREGRVRFMPLDLPL